MRVEAIACSQHRAHIAHANWHIQAQCARARAWRRVYFLGANSRCEYGSAHAAYPYGDT